MKFKDLKFENYRSFNFDQHAVVTFENGYGISVINGECAYCDEYTYEVGITKDGRMCYETPLTADVLGYQTPEDIDKILEEVESYNRNQY